MTFKHVKFEDSPTMRALEKVAREKGLVKPEPLTKKASLTKKADLTPSANLMENIFKLCNGLREQGMVKDAADLETKYLQFKQAQTLYETSKETGEDLVESAHPDGSHKLEDVDSTEAVVEDILDKHDKIEEVAEKNPKGKLSDAKSVIARVKTVLGQDAGAPKYSPEDIGRWYRVTVDNKLWAALNAAREGLSIAQRAVTAGFVVQDQTFGSDYTDMAHAIQQANVAWQQIHTGGPRNTAAPTMEGINAMKEGINDAINRLDAFNQDGQAMRSQTEAKFREALSIVTQCAATVQAYNADPNSLPPGVVPPQAPAAPVVGGYADYKKQLASLQARNELYQGRRDYDKVPPASKQKVIEFLANVKTDIDNMNQFLDQHKGDPDTITANKGDIESRIANIAARLNTYKAKVIDKAPQTSPTGNQ